MARQDSRHRSPKKGRDAECTYSSELAQLRLTGHVTRMHEERLPKKILHGELEMGKRSHGGQKKRYKKSKRKVQGVSQLQTAALPRPQEEEETDKSKQAQTEQTYEKH